MNVRVRLLKHRTGRLRCSSDHRLWGPQSPCGKDTQAAQWRGTEASHQQPVPTSHLRVLVTLEADPLSPGKSADDPSPWPQPQPRSWVHERPWARTTQLSQSQDSWSLELCEIINADCSKPQSFKVTGYTKQSNEYISTFCCLPPEFWSESLVFQKSPRLVSPNSIKFREELIISPTPHLFPQLAIANGRPLESKTDTWCALLFSCCSVQCIIVTYRIWLRN